MGHDSLPQQVQLYEISQCTTKRNNNDDNNNDNNNSNNNDYNNSNSNLNDYYNTYIQFIREIGLSHRPESRDISGNFKGQMNQKIDIFSFVALPSPNTKKNHPK